MTDVPGGENFGRQPGMCREPIKMCTVIWWVYRYSGRKCGGKFSRTFDLWSFMALVGPEGNAGRQSRQVIK